jgi:glycine/D-amino acid oxidase-like deaminating enzyme
MARDLDPVVSNDALPERADVVVIGGGVIGVATAMFLAEEGQKVVLCEKGEIAGEQSSRNWGWCRAMGRDPRELPLILESLKLWRGMNARIGAETGFRQIGTMYLCKDEAALEKRIAWTAHAKAHGLNSIVLRGKEVAQALEGTADQWTGALHTPTDGVAEPSMAVPAMASYARSQGAVILQNCAARGLELTGGRVSAVVTEKGTIACDRVVLAGGAWAGLFARSLGLRLPQLKVLASVQRTAAVNHGPPMASWGPGLAQRKRLDGGYNVSHGQVVAQITPDSFRYFKEFLPLLRMEWDSVSLKFGKSFFEERELHRPWALDGISPFEKVRVLDPTPDAADLAAGRAQLEKSFPAFKGVPTLATWGGMIDATPDTVPVISPVDQIPGLVISAGYSGHGFGIGPGAGRLTADLISGKTPIVDPTPFRFSRFSDGSVVRPVTGV